MSDDRPSSSALRLASLGVALALTLAGPPPAAGQDGTVPPYTEAQVLKMFELGMLPARVAQLVYQSCLQGPVDAARLRRAAGDPRVAEAILLRMCPSSPSPSPSPPSTGGPDTGRGACMTRGISLGMTVSGSLEAGDCQFDTSEKWYDRYQLSLTSPAVVASRMSTTALTPALYVRSTTDVLVGGVEFTNAQPGTLTAEWLLPSGTYHVEASRKGASEPPGGAYQLGLTTVVGDTASCGVSVYAAMGARVTRELGPSDCAGTRGREDRITVHLQRGQVLTVTMTSSAFDAFLLLSDDSDRSLATDDDGAGGTDARIIFTAPETGFYQVRPTGYDSAARGRYTISFSR